MKVTVTMPKVADSVDEVAIVGILVRPDHEVTVGDPLLEVETDKAQVQIPSPVAGVIGEILVAVDDEVATGAPVMTINSRGGP